MNKRNNKIWCRDLVITVVVLIIACALTMILFEGIYYSDMPMWLKYFLLS